MYVILVYDIMIDETGPRTWRQIFNIAKRYLHHIQNSVFEGELTEAKIMRLKKELQQWIRKDRDSVLLFKSREARWLKKEFWGKEEDGTSVFL